MKRLIALKLLLVLAITACATGAPTITEISASIPDTAIPEPPNPTDTPKPPIPTATNTPVPSPTPTLKPTVDINLVLTPVTTVEYEIHYFVLSPSDSVTILGKQFGDAGIAVILAHQGTIGANQRDWEDFAKLIAERGYTAVTFDFRGYGRSKGDSQQTNYLIIDMQAVIDRLQMNGYKRIVCMGASMGGTTCLKAAIDFDLEGVVVIGSLFGLGPPTKVEPEELAELKIPKLFITTENDGYGVPEAVTSMYDISQEPKRLLVFPGEVHGTEMFNQPYGNEFTAELLAFLEDLR